MGSNETARVVGGKVAGGLSGGDSDVGSDVDARPSFGTGTDPALLAALTALAGRTRELVEAVVLSDAAIAELGAAAAEIGDLAARLGACRRPPIRFEVDPSNGRLHQPHSPVTGEANPLAPPIRIATTPEGTARAEFNLGAVTRQPRTQEFPARMSFLSGCQQFDLVRRRTGRGPGR